MDRKRVQEIKDSPDMVPVFFNERAIYIEDINPTKDAASVHYIDQPSNSEEVPLFQLVEGKEKQT
jgi:H-type small acid-soluble spore protein